MTPEVMAEIRPRLEAFAAAMFAGFARADPRVKGELYLRGLMLDGQRKSMQPMAERLGVDHQQLQQFDVPWVLRSRLGGLHATLAAVAQAFCTTLRLDSKVPAPA